MRKYFPRLLFFFNFIIVFILYYPARYGRFVHDFINWAYKYNQYSLADILKCRSDNSYHLFYQLFFYLAYKLFHTNAVAWLTLFSVLHAATATMFFVLFKKIFEDNGTRYSFGIALTGALLALMSPFATETVAWGATVQYFISAICLFSAWWLIIQYLNKNKLIYLVTAHFVFFIAMFSLEIAISFPIIMGLYLWWSSKQRAINPENWLFILLPLVLIVFSFFAVNRIVKGNWVGHYGAAVHLNLAPAFMSSQLASYFIKYLAFVHYFKYPTRDSLYSFIQRPVIGNLLFVVLYIVPLIFLLLRYKRISVNIKLALVVYFFMCLALFPTQNMYFMYLFQVVNERLGYFFSWFFYLFIAYVVISLLGRTGFLLLFIYGIIGLYFLRTEIDSWRQTGDTVRSLNSEYKWANEPGTVHILTLGDNINGVHFFINYNDSAFLKQYTVLTGEKCPPIQQYLYMAMTNENDSVNAVITNDSTIEVDLLNKDNWLMKDGLGATDYNTELARIEINKQKPSFTITFKNKKQSDVYIYESGKHWKQVTGF